MDSSIGTVSIVLPIYNVQQYLDRCMDTLFNQTYKDIEILMINDGSTDKCGEMCDRYRQIDSRVCVFHKANGGLSDARNYGIERAHGNYITCIDPDDFVDVNYVEYLAELVKKYNTKMAICQHRVIYDNGTIKDFGKCGDEVLDNKVCIERMLYHDVIDTSAWGKIYRKDLFENVKYPKGKIFEDIGTTYELMLQCSRIAVGYESRYNYIFHNQSIVNSEFSISKFDLIEMTDKMGKDVLNVFPELINAVKRRQVYSRISTLNQMLLESGYKNERKNILCFIKNNRKSVFLNPKTPKRDRVALILLSINYYLYRFVWLSYRKVIMKKV